MSTEQHEHRGEPPKAPQSATQGGWRRYGFTLCRCARTLAYKAIQAWLKSEIQELVQRFVDGASGLS